MARVRSPPVASRRPPRWGSAIVEDQADRTDSSSPGLRRACARAMPSGTHRARQARAATARARVSSIDRPRVPPAHSRRSPRLGAPSADPLAGSAAMRTRCRACRAAASRRASVSRLRHRLARRRRTAQARLNTRRASTLRPQANGDQRPNTLRQSVASRSASFTPRSPDAIRCGSRAKRCSSTAKARLGVATDPVVARRRATHRRNRTVRPPRRGQSRIVRPEIARSGGEIVRLRKSQGQAVARRAVGPPPRPGATPRGSRPRARARRACGAAGRETSRAGHGRRVSLREGRRCWRRRRWPPALERRGARDQRAGAGVGALARGLSGHAAVHLQDDVAAAVVDQLARALDLAKLQAMKLLAAEAGVDRAAINTRSMSSITHSIASSGVAGLSTTPGSRAEFTDAAQGAVRVRTGLRMHAHQIGARLAEAVEQVSRATPSGARRRAAWCADGSPSLRPARWSERGRSDCPSRLCGPSRSRRLIARTSSPSRAKSLARIGGG